MSKQCKDCEEAADLLRAEGRWAIDGAISILESGVVSDTVTIPRAEYERLLSLTTPIPITAQEYADDAQGE